MSFDNPDGLARADMECKEFVELITAYLDGILPGEAQRRIDDHLDGCDGCRNVLAQWRTIIALAGRLTEADVDNTDPITHDRLLSIVRGLRRR